jgi:hypothetical protein
VHITIDQKIAAYSAVRIRQLMRETVGNLIENEDIRRVLGGTDSVATRVLKRLRTEGYILSIGDQLHVSMKGSALAMATAAPPLRRETAARLIAGLVERARALNEDAR